MIPVYASLYSKTGFLFGWLNLTNLADTNAMYALNWVKGTPPHPGALFPAGFTNILLTLGSPWVNPGTVALAAGTTLGLSNADSNLQFPVEIKNKNALFNPSSTPTNSLAGTINLNNGLLQITFGNGNGRQTTRGFGVMLQDSTNGAGYFTTKTNAGTILLQSTNLPDNIPAKE